MIILCVLRFYLPCAVFNFIWVRAKHQKKSIQYNKTKIFDTKI